MTQLSLYEIEESQLNEVSLVDGQLIVCLDTGNMYRDTDTERIPIGSDIITCSSLPLAPISNKMYLVGTKLYIWNGANWLWINKQSISSISINGTVQKADANGNVDIHMPISGGDVSINSDHTMSVNKVDASKINGTLADKNIPNLDASKVTKGTFDKNRIPGLDASKITSGTIDIARLPKAALDNLVKVQTEAKKLALTTKDVQNGDSVKVIDSGVLYLVVDDTKLNSAEGYEPYTAEMAAAVEWSNVVNRPETMKGATSTADGKGGLIPQPKKGDQGKFLSGDGTYKSITKVANATKASQDSQGNVINTYYMKRGSYAKIVGTQAKHNDLNKYTEAGFYNVDTTYVNNCPTGIVSEAVLLVYTKDASGYASQEITEIGSTARNRKWVRHSTDSDNTAWTDWTAFYSTDNKPTKTDVGLSKVDNTADSEKTVKAAGSATVASKLGTADVGSSWKPTYLAKGVPKQVDVSSNTKRFPVVLVADSSGESHIGHTLVFHSTAKDADGRANQVKLTDSGIEIDGITSGEFKGNLAGNVKGNLDGNAKTATSATNDSSGKKITDTYVHRTGDLINGDLSFTLPTTNNARKLLFSLNQTASGHVAALKGSGLELATSNKDTAMPIYVKQYNDAGKVLKTVTLLDASGNTKFCGTVQASTFKGSLSGNATTASSARVYTKGPHNSQSAGSFYKIASAVVTSSEESKELVFYVTNGTPDAGQTHYYLGVAKVQKNKSGTENYALIKTIARNGMTNQQFFICIVQANTDLTSVELWGTVTGDYSTHRVSTIQNNGWTVSTDKALYAVTSSSDPIYAIDSATVEFANRAEKDIDGNIIANTYVNSLKVADHTITLYSKKGDVLASAKYQDDNTWRPVVDNLTSKETAHSLSANQGRVLNNTISNHVKTKTGNPHGVTKSDVGFGNVVNLAPAQLTGDNAVGEAVSAQKAQKDSNNQQIVSTYIKSIDIKDNAFSYLYGNDTKREYTLTPTYRMLTIALNANNWTENENKTFSQTVSNANITAKDDAICLGAPNTSSTPAQLKSYQKAFGIVSSGTAVTNDGSVKFTTAKKPATSINVNLLLTKYK